MPESFKISDKVLSQKVNGEIVLLDLGGEQYYSLNFVGARVWQLLAEGKNYGEILFTLEQHYEVEQTELESDVAVLLDGLEAAGLIVRHS